MKAFIYSACFLFLPVASFSHFALCMEEEIVFELN